MDELIEIDPKEPIELRRAWDVFSDLAVPGMNYRKKIKDLLRPVDGESYEQTSKRLTEHDHLVRSLQKQLRYCICDGSFLAFGFKLDAPGGFSNRVRIAGIFFEPGDGRSKVEWESNRLEYDGHVFAGVEVVPDIEHLQSQWPAHREVYGPLLKQPPPEKASLRSKGSGRPNYKTNAVALIGELLKEHTFKMMRPRSRQAEEVRARLVGEGFREAHDYPGLKTETLARWIGEVDV